MWEWGHEEGWVPKNWCFQTVVLEKILDSPLDCKEIKPVSAMGNKSWIFIGRTEAEAAILWPPDAKSWLTEKDLDAGKDWGQKKGVTEDKMARWHHQLNGHESEQTLGDTEGQGRLVCYRPWGRKEWDTTEWLNSKPSQNIAGLSKILKTFKTINDDFKVSLFSWIIIFWEASGNLIL